MQAGNLKWGLDLEPERHITLQNSSPTRVCCTQEHRRTIDHCMSKMQLLLSDRMLLTTATHGAYNSDTRYLHQRIQHHCQMTPPLKTDISLDGMMPFTALYIIICSSRAESSTTSSRSFPMTGTEPSVWAPASTCHLHVTGMVQAWYHSSCGQVSPCPTHRQE